MSKNRNYGSQTSFLDLLFNSLLAFVGFFILTLMYIKENDNKSPMDQPKVEFLITLTWPAANDDDIDLWMVDPLDSIVYFGRKEDGLMHLDRDDIGNKNDEITLPDGKKFTYRENREVITIRRHITGEYVLNLHVFKKRSSGVVKANVKIEKLNPYSTVFVKEVDLGSEGEEVTICRMGLNGEGVVTSLKDGPKRSLIQKKVSP